MLRLGEEALGEERSLGRGAGRAQVVDGAAEARVHEHRDRGRAVSPERVGDRGRIGVGPQVARRGRAALHLGDRAESGPCERVREPSHQASAWEKRMSASSRTPAALESTASRAIS